MIINKTFLHNIQQKSTDQNTSFRNLNSPSYDTVSFGAMKKMANGFYTGSFYTALSYIENEGILFKTIAKSVFL